MNTATVATAWAGTGAGKTPYRPAFAADYPAASWTDTSGESVAKIKAGTAAASVRATLDAATLVALQADARYLGKVTLIPWPP